LKYFAIFYKKAFWRNFGGFWRIIEDFGGFWMVENFLDFWDFQDF
jgi:hypothetical protein